METQIATNGTGLNTTNAVKIELPNRSSLEEALKLTDEIERARLVAETANKEIISLESRLRDLLGGVEVVSTSHTPEHEEMRGRQGKMKQLIMEMLKKSGKRGVEIGEVAQQLGVKKENVSAWFAITGKKNPKIVRIAPGRYMLER